MLETVLLDQTPSLGQNLQAQLLMLTLAGWVPTHPIAT